MINKLGMRARILNLVDSHSGILSRVLIGQLACEYLSISLNDIRLAIMDLLAEDRMREVEFIIDGKSQSLFIPNRTDVRIK